MALKGRRFSEATMIQAKSRDALAEFQTVDLTSGNASKSGPEGTTLNGGVTSQKIELFILSHLL
jgi:hypothetical protein